MWLLLAFFPPNASLPEKRSSNRPFLRIILAVAALIGFAFSIYYNRILAQLRDDHANLQKQAGLLEVPDRSKVAISYIPVNDDLIPPGVTEAHVWRYRVYIPANFGVCHSGKCGLISADSPQGQGGGTDSWNSPQAEPEETLVTLALIKSDGQWMFSRTNGGSSSTSNVPQDLDFSSLEDLVIEPIVSATDPTRDFDVDEPICLLRVREKDLAKKRNGQKHDNLYRGCSVYMHSADRKDAFTAWANGKTDTMAEVER